MVTLVLLSLCLAMAARANSQIMVEPSIRLAATNDDQEYDCASVNQRYESIGFVLPEYGSLAIGIEMNDVHTRMAYIKPNLTRGYLARPRMRKNVELLNDAEGHTNFLTFPECAAAEGNGFEESQQVNSCSRKHNIFSRHPEEFRRRLAHAQGIPEPDVSLSELDEALTAGLVNATANVLRRMKSIATKSLSEEIEAAVLAIPTYFTDAQRAALRCGGAAAGLSILRLVHKPVAAAYAVGLDELLYDHDAERYVLEVNFGSRGIDVTVMELDEGVYEILGTAHDGCHGREWVTRFVSESLSKSTQLHRGTSLNDSYSPKRSLEHKVSSAMDSLRTMPAVDVEVSHNSFSTLTSEYLEKIVVPALSKIIISLVDSALEETSIQRTNINQLLLSGQSAQIPGFQTMLEKHLGIAAIDNNDFQPEYAVAIGVAMQAAILVHDDSCLGCMMEDAGKNLGIEIAGGSILNLIHASNTIPATQAVNFTTYHDGQTRVDFRISEQQPGEAPVVVDILSLDIPPAMRGTPHIEVRFALDADRFRADVIHVESGKSASLTRSKDAVSTTLDTSQLIQNGGEVVVFDTLLLSGGTVDEL